MQLPLFGDTKFSRKECKKLTFKWNMDKIIFAGFVHGLILVFIYNMMHQLILRSFEVFCTASKYQP